MVLIRTLSHVVGGTAETQKRADGKTSEEGEKTQTSEEEQQEEEEETSVSAEAELARMEERWREQCVINGNLKLLLAEEQRFKVHDTHFTLHAAKYPLHWIIFSFQIAVMWSLGVTCVWR